MKLRIKKTGEVLEDVKYIDTTLSTITIQYLDDGILRETRIKNLSDIEEVKDYEEHYFITEYGEVYSLNEYEGLNNVANPEDYRQIGNYFESEEEAKRALEKLKAVKRLKDNGFKITGWGFRDDEVGIFIRANCPSNTVDELDLLFGGEE